MTHEQSRFSSVIYFIEKQAHLEEVAESKVCSKKKNPHKQKATKVHAKLKAEHEEGANKHTRQGRHSNYKLKPEPTN